MSEEVQNGLASDGRGIVVWVDELAEPSAPTPAEINGGTRLTYGLTPDGFTIEPTINDVITGRYTLDQELRLEGTKRYAITTRYVYNRGTPTDAEEILGDKGAEGYLIHALGYPNAHEFENGDVINAVAPVRVGTSTDVPPTANTELAKQMIPEVIGEVLTEVVVGGES